MTIRTKTLASPAHHRLSGRGALAGGALADAGSGKSDNSKVKICHRTNANNNPSRFIEVATEAADGKSKGDHALEHQGPVWNLTLKPADIKWGDIIPEYTDDRGFLRNSCSPPCSPGGRGGPATR